MTNSTQTPSVMFVRYDHAPVDDQVSFFHTEDPRGVLIVGQTYAVERREVHSWHTRLFLAGVDSGVGFNDVTFEVLEAAESPSSSGVHGRTE